MGFQKIDGHRRKGIRNRTGRRAFRVVVRVSWFRSRCKKDPRPEKPGGSGRGRRVRRALNDPRRCAMVKSRREFLSHTAAGFLGAAAAARAAAGAAAAQPEPPVTPVAGTPPAFGTAPPIGPEITAATVAEAEKLMRVELTPAERAQLAGNWRQAMASTMERRTGPRKVRPLTPRRAPRPRAGTRSFPPPRAPPRGTGSSAPTAGTRCRRAMRTSRLRRSPTCRAGSSRAP